MLVALCYQRIIYATMKLNRRLGLLKNRTGSEENCEEWVFYKLHSKMVEVTQKVWNLEKYVQRNWAEGNLFLSIFTGYNCRIYHSLKLVIC